MTGTTANFRMVHLGHRGAAHPGHPDLGDRPGLFASWTAPPNASSVERARAVALSCGNLFWFFGIPRSHHGPAGFGIVAELLPVFCRKPLSGTGVRPLASSVWPYCRSSSGASLFQAASTRYEPTFMLTTELISIPTGFIYLVAWERSGSGRSIGCAHACSVSCVLHFLIGGSPGFPISDVPVDVTVHGTSSYGPLSTTHHGG